MLNTLSIISGKGGSGKTSLAILLSQLFSSCGQKILLVDCDMSTHGATYFFEELLNQKEKYYTVSNILYGGINLQQSNLEILQLSSNIGFVPSRIDFSSKKKSGELTDSSKLQLFLNKIESQGYNIVIFDCQAGYSIETETAVSISKTNLAVIEADAISATALRVLYAQLAKQLDNGKTYQVFNKISKEEQEIYSKLTHGTFFTNVTPILFDWNVRKAFVTNELPEINTSNSILATSIYELALVLFPKYKDDLRKFILDIKQKKFTSLEKELKIIRLSSKTESLKKMINTVYLLVAGIGIVITFVTNFFIDSSFKIHSDHIPIIFAIILFIICIVLFATLLVRRSQNNEHRKMMLKIENEQEQLEEEISQIKMKLNQQEK
jgi:MinD-like ATPase involved in chromosome partitioning or flagellar assembly